MLSPFRTPAPPDDRVELEEIEQWLMSLPAPPGYGAKPRAPFRRSIRLAVGVVGWLSLAALFALLVVASPEIPGLVVLAVVSLGSMFFATPWAHRRIVRRNMRRAGLLPPSP